MAKKSKNVRKYSSFSKKEFTFFMLIFALVGAVTLLVSFAAPRNGSPAGTCAYSAAASGGVVAAEGLPNGTVINFLTHDDVTGSQTGWVLGIADNGTWTVNVPAPTHSTTYDFVSKTWGKNGSKYNIYAECTQTI